MHKQNIVDAVSKEVSITKTKAAEVVDTFIKIISKSLKKGQEVSIMGFGAFKVVKTKARKGRNIQTGKEIQIKAGKKVKFVTGSALKKAVK